MGWEMRLRNGTDYVYNPLMDVKDAKNKEVGEKGRERNDGGFFFF